MCSYSNPSSLQGGAGVPSIRTNSFYFRILDFLPFLLPLSSTDMCNATILICHTACSHLPQATVLRKKPPSIYLRCGLSKWVCAAHIWRKVFVYHETLGLKSKEVVQAKCAIGPEPYILLTDIAPLPLDTITASMGRNQCARLLLWWWERLPTIKAVELSVQPSSNTKFAFSLLKSSLLIKVKVSAF